MLAAVACWSGPGRSRCARRRGPREQLIEILARRFTYSPNLLKLRKGVPVVLELTSADVVMGLSVRDLQGRADIIPGRVTGTPRAGQNRYLHFLCDIFCGSGNETMNGTITVSG